MKHFKNKSVIRSKDFAKNIAFNLKNQPYSPLSNIQINVVTKVNNCLVSSYVYLYCCTEGADEKRNTRFFRLTLLEHSTCIHIKNDNAHSRYLNWCRLPSQPPTPLASTEKPEWVKVIITVILSQLMLSIITELCTMQSIIDLQPFLVAVDGIWVGGKMYLPDWWINWLVDKSIIDATANLLFARNVSPYRKPVIWSNVKRPGRASHGRDLFRARKNEQTALNLVAI